MNQPPHIAEQYQKHFSKHFLAFGWRTNAPGKGGFQITQNERFVVTAGFLATYRDVWVLITAGHILEQLEHSIKAGYKAYQFRIFDSLGPSAEHRAPLPFDYRSDKTWWENNADGLDFGIVVIPELQALLEKNQKQPIDLEADCKDVPDHFDDYAMYGLPTVFEKLDRNGDSWSITYSPTLIHLEDVSTEETPNHLKGKAPRWFLRLPPVDENMPLPGEECLHEIDGMSGGPVFGIKKMENGTLRYWTIGIQSAWYPRSRIVAITPLRLLKTLLERYLQTIESDPKLLAEVTRKAKEEDFLGPPASGGPAGGEWGKRVSGFRESKGA